MHFNGTFNVSLSGVCVRAAGPAAARARARARMYRACVYIV